MATFCARFYRQQRDADVRHPGVTRGSALAYDRVVLAATRADQRFLERLRPPADEAATFAAFIADSRAVLRARAAIARAHAANQDPAAPQAAFDSAIDARHRWGARLGVSECDGRLPSKQSAAAVAAVRRFTMTTDVQAGCGDLVTSTFVRTQWHDSQDPMASCAAVVRRLRDDPGAKATGIEVHQVTGVDDLTATVHFDEVGGCCAGQATVARLYLVKDRWLIHAMSYE